MATRLASLGAPTWGERLVLARRRSGLSLEQAAERISDVMPTSYGTLVRLEKMTEPPPDMKRRLVAFLALMAYGFDPTGFDLSTSDVPKWINADSLAEWLESWEPTKRGNHSDAENQRYVSCQSHRSQAA